MTNLSISQTLDLAVQHHQNGNFRQAESLYRQVLQVDPHNAEALHLLGVIAHQVGRNDLAVDYIQQALRLQPRYPIAYNNLGAALKDRDPRARQDAARLLGALGADARDAIVALGEARQDDVEAVRTAAAEALLRINTR